MLNTSAGAGVWRLLPGLAFADGRGNAVSGGRDAPGATRAAGCQVSACRSLASITLGTVWLHEQSSDLRPG